MAYAQLVSPQLLKAVETVNNLGTKTGSFTISWADGHFQYYTTSGNTTLAFSNWPTSAYYTKLRLQITTDTTNRTVTFPSAVSVGLSDIQGAVGQVVTLPTAGVYLFELTTLDNGSTITIQDLLRNYDIVTTGSSGAFTSLNVSGNVLSTGLSVFGNTTISGNLNVAGNINILSVQNASFLYGTLIAYGSSYHYGEATFSGATTTVSGNIVTTGAHIETGYRQLKPTANIAVTANVGINRLLLHPTGTIVSFGANVTLPNTQVDGTIVSISSNVTISSLAVTPNWNGVVTVSPFGNTSSVLAGTVSRYMYIAADYQWYKIA
jgi:hypothetical protein